jgi:pilus assembly protein CpaE
MITELLERNITMIGALLRSSSVADSLKSAAQSNNRLVLLPMIGGRLDLGSLRAVQADVLLVEVNLADPAEIRVLGDFVSDGAAPPIIVTSPSFDVQSMRALMKIGILDILPQPISIADFDKAIDNALSRQSRMPVIDRPKKGPVVSFLKSGGGAGATSLIVQGACAIARGKKSDAPAVLDLDVQFGAAAIQMDAEQRVSILDLVRDPERLDSALLQAAMVRPHGRFDLLAAPSQILSVDGIDAFAIDATIAMASRTYSRTLIDLPMLWNSWVHAALEASDVIVLVVRLTVPSLRRARSQIDMLRSESLAGIPLFIVANAVDTGYFSSTKLFLKKAETALGRKIDFCIPRSDAMQLAADQGQPLNGVAGGKSLEAKLASMMAEIFKKTEVNDQIKAIIS